MTAWNHDPMNEAKPHTIKKFELISSYVDEWSRKILGYEKSQGIVFIDCMCNCGMYYDEQKNLIEGTAIRIIKRLNEIITNYPGKRAFLYFNDISEEKINVLKYYVDLIPHENLEISFSIMDCNDFLKSFDIHRFPKFNTLMIYDPFEATLDWSAITPYLNIWGEVIINHMVSDTTRGAKVAQKDKTIEKYQETYQKSIEEIISLGSDKKELDRIILKIIKNQTENTGREHFVASFPFFNSKNGQVYNLIHCCSNINGLILFKKVAWKTFGGKSSIKDTHGNQNQLFIDIDSCSVKSIRDDNCFFVNDIASYIFEKYSRQGEVNLDIIYNDLNRHPVFPSDGFKNLIKDELKTMYHAKVTKKKTIVFPIQN